jgi:hypothetical protein
VPLIRHRRLASLIEPDFKRLSAPRLEAARHCEIVLTYSYPQVFAPLSRLLAQIWHNGVQTSANDKERAVRRRGRHGPPSLNDTSPPSLIYRSRSSGFHSFSGNRFNPALRANFRCRPSKARASYAAASPGPNRSIKQFAQTDEFSGKSVDDILRGEQRREAEQARVGGAEEPDGGLLPAGTAQAATQRTGPSPAGMAARTLRTREHAKELRT